MFRRIFLVFILTVAATCGAKADVELKEFLPSIGGVMRTRYEIQTTDGQGRFAVNNARVWLRGNVLPQLSYYVCTDLCNQGQMQFLDGYGRFDFSKGFAIQAGQFRIPFGVDPFRGPGGYMFADRSFIGRDIDNIRAVGLQGSYTFQKSLPAVITLGVFSPNVITNHNHWSKTYNAALKAELPVGPFKITGGVQTIKPDSTRINMADAAVYFAKGRWQVEAEYMFKHYVRNSFPNVNAYNFWIDYALPLKKTIFQTLSFQGRFDGATRHSNGTSVGGFLSEDHPGRKRITAGATLRYAKKPLKCELQLNYEKFFYDKGAEPVVGRNDKVVVELIISF